MRKRLAFNTMFEFAFEQLTDLHRGEQNTTLETKGSEHPGSCVCRAPSVDGGRPFAGRMPVGTDVEVGKAGCGPVGRRWKAPHESPAGLVYSSPLLVALVC